MPVGQRDDDALLVDRLDGEPRAGALRAHEADVEPAALELAQLLGRAELVQSQRDVGGFLAERPQPLGDDRVHRRADEADGEPADLAPLHAAGFERRGLHGVEDLPRALEERGAGRGQLHAVLVAQQQLGADLLLELADLLAQRRLGHVQALGRAAEMQLLRDGDEVAEVAELHAAITLAAWPRPAFARDGPRRRSQMAAWPRPAF